MIIMCERVLKLITSLALVFVLVACSSMPKDGRMRSVDVEPEVREAFAAAMVAINAGDYEEGEEILSGVISQSQQTPVPLINLAMVRVKLDRLDGAEQALKAALDIEPNNPVASNELGLLYRKTGRFEEARQVYESILSKYPDYPAANKNLGVLCDLYLRDYACAYRAYQAYSAAVPDDASAKIWVVDAQQRAGM